MKLSKIPAIFTAAIMAFSASSASALVLTVDDLNDGAAAIVIDDATDFIPNDGIVFFAGAIGDFDLNVSTGFGDPYIGGGDPYFAGTSLDFTAASKLSSGTAELEISLLDTGLSILTGAASEALVNGPISFTTVLGAAVTVENYIDINGTGEQLISTLAGVDGAFSSNDSIFASLSDTDTFDLRTVVKISHESRPEGDGLTSGGAIEVNVSPVPVPAGLPLLLTALAGLGFYGRRRTAA